MLGFKSITMETICKRKVLLINLNYYSWNALISQRFEANRKVKHYKFDTVLQQQFCVGKSTILDAFSK